MNVGVVGTGHVGLVTGACLAEKGHRVRCVDNDRAKIAMLRRSRMPIYEPGLEALVRRHVRAGRLTFGTSIPEVVDRSLVIFICVGTPPLDSGAPDMSYVEHVVREIAPALRDYRVIAEKSTVPVQTGQRLRAKLLPTSTQKWANRHRGELWTAASVCSLRSSKIATAVAQNRLSLEVGSPGITAPNLTKHEGESIVRANDERIRTLPV